MTALNNLFLYDNCLLGQIPTELELMAELDVVQFQDNALSQTIPTELAAQMTKLSHMMLDDNKLTGIIPTELGLVTAMRKIDFSHNSLIGANPTELGMITALADHYLTSNHQSGQIPTELGLTALTTLALIRNDLIGSLPSEMCHANSNIYIDFDNVACAARCSFYGQPCYCKCTLVPVLSCWRRTH